MAILRVYVDASTVEKRGEKLGLGAMVIEDSSGVVFERAFRLGTVKGSTFSEFKALEVVFDKFLGNFGEKVMRSRNVKELRFLVDNENLFKLIEVNFELNFPKRARIREAMLRLLRKKEEIKRKYKLAVTVQRIPREQNKADRLIREEFPWFFKKGHMRYSEVPVFTIGDLIQNFLKEGER